MTWELIWMLVILKIPVVYLCLRRLVGDPREADAARAGAAHGRAPDPTRGPAGGSRGSARAGPAAGRTASPVARARARVARAEVPR